MGWTGNQKRKQADYEQNRVEGALRGLLLVFHSRSCKVEGSQQGLSTGGCKTVATES